VTARPPRPRKNDPPPDHGSPAGYLAHTYRGDTPCRDCRQAWATFAPADIVDPPLAGGRRATRATPDHRRALTPDELARRTAATAYMRSHPLHNAT
jgi:hypothetical protein